MTGDSPEYFIVADDHPLYRDAVRAQIERMFPHAVVEEASSIAELFERFGDGAHDVGLLLLDLVMPGMSPAVVGRVAERFPGVPIAVISGGADALAIRECVEAGARGFIPKTASAAHFAHAVQILLSGGTTIPADALLGGHVAAEGGESEGDWVATLNAREMGVVRGVARGHSNKQIARELGIAEVTVKFHLRVLFRKVGASNRAQLAVAAAKAGVA